MPPTPNRGDSKVGCGRSKQWLGDGRQVSGILQPFCVDAQPSGSIPTSQQQTDGQSCHPKNTKQPKVVSFVPKPLRNCSLKNPKTLVLEPTKQTFGTHKKQSFGNRCRQLSRKACARCLWRSGSDRRTQRKKSHGGAPSSNTPPFDHNHKSCPSHAKPQKANLCAM